MTKTTSRTISTKTTSKLDSEKVQIQNKNSWLETVELNSVVQIKKRFKLNPHSINTRNDERGYSMPSVFGDQLFVEYFVCLAFIYTERFSVETNKKRDPKESGNSN